MTLTRKIAFEEHFSAVGFDDYSKAFVKHINTQASSELNARLADFDDTRIQLMDQYAIDYVILSQTGPGVQNEPDAATAVRRSRQNNDFLAAQIDRNRERFGGFATLPMQDPGAAIEELRRTVNDLGFKARWSMAIRTVSIMTTDNMIRSGSSWKNWVCRFICIPLMPMMFLTPIADTPSWWARPGGGV